MHGLPVDVGRVHPQGSEQPRPEGLGCPGIVSAGDGAPADSPGAMGGGYSGSPSSSASRRSRSRTRLSRSGTRFCVA